ncbi:MAG: ATP-binding protein [Deltaproteobacteria bacterium]|nr:ATP-binding protein [Deltaproteobacteria bacterium]
MKYLAESYAEAIISRLEEAFAEPTEFNREHRFVLPSQRADLTHKLGLLLEEFVLSQEMTVDFIFKVGNALGKRWAGGSEKELHHFDGLKARGWYDQTNSLTVYRNRKRGFSDFLVVVLIGIDHVRDHGSLADMFQIDDNLIWQEALRGTFKPWLRRWLDHAHVAYENDHLFAMDDLLISLIRCSLAGLYDISSFLEQLPMEGIQDGRDAYLTMTSSMDRFRLPVIRDVPRSKRKKGVRPYIEAAVSFFAYSDFLEDSRRKSALKAIGSYRSENKGTLEEDDLGTEYQNEEELLSDLEAYIRDHSHESRQRLFSANFVKIKDNILGFRKRPPRSAPRTKKVSGSPLEAALTAVWLTLADFSKQAAENYRSPREEIREIHLIAEQFKHDCGGETKAEADQHAMDLLEKCLGGLDDILEQRVQIDCGQETNDTVRVISQLTPSRCKQGTISGRLSRSAEPGLIFNIKIVSENLDPVARKFQWRFPETHPFRTIRHLFRWAAELGKQDNFLPVYSVPYYTELMLAKDDEEINRIMMEAVRKEELREEYNLLNSPQLPKDDPVRSACKDLAFHYGKLAVTIDKVGFYRGLMQEWEKLRDAYDAACRLFNEQYGAEGSEMGPLLFKAFSIVPSIDDGFNPWEPFVRSAVITALHPALLEMIYHQCAFLCEGFSHAVKENLKSTDRRIFRESYWMDVVDLTAIHSPLFGLLCDEDRKLDTTISGTQLVHRIGKREVEEASLTTRLMLRYDSIEEEDISDTELFRKTRESSLIKHILEDYSKLNPQVSDGISIAAYSGDTIQPLIAGLDQFIREQTESMGEQGIYNVSLTLYADTTDDTGVARWIAEWRKRWDELETTSLRHYSRCNISVSHRLVTRDRNFSEFVNMIRNSLEVDISFLMHFIEAGKEGNELRRIAPYVPDLQMMKFPILEKAGCIEHGPGTAHKRYRIVSNRQFLVPSLHAELMARLKNNYPQQALDSQHIVLGVGDFHPWESVVDAFHEKSSWVVCIDPCVDEMLVSRTGKHGQRKRDIIGFGSGVGAHGEHNYTVSTEFFHLSDIKHKIAVQVSSLFPAYNKEECDKIAESVIRESQNLSGLSLVRATGLSEYVRDYLAYILTRKLIPKSETAFCDEIVSLDAFRHWFESDGNSSRPDLLHLAAKIRGELIEIDAHLIECKLASASAAHLEKAHEQLDRGLRRLMKCFRPRQQSDNAGDYPPDQRYWWLQLHRLISSRSVVPRADRERVLSVLEKLTDGYFKICWRASALTFWTDETASDIHLTATWPFELYGFALDINVLSTGSKLIGRLCLEADIPSLPESEIICFPQEDVFGECKENDIDAQEPSTRGLDDQVSRSDVKSDVAGLSPKNGGDQVPPSSISKGLSTGKVSNGKRLPSVSVEIPERVFLGKTITGERRIYWEFGHKGLHNRHMLIFGSSGMGKTYAIQCLLFELAKSGQNSLVVDYTNGFLPKQLEKITITKLSPIQHMVAQAPLPISTFKRQPQDYGEGDLVLEKKSSAAKRIASIFQNVYGLGEQQFSVLFDAIFEGMSKYGENMTLNRLLDILQEYISDSVHNKTASMTTLSKLKPFVLDEPFLSDAEGIGWQEIFNNRQHRCHVFQLANMDFHSWRLITEFVLWDLYAFVRSCGDRHHPKVVVLDEVQNLDQREEAPFAKYLTEGRKFGISLILATQTLSNLSTDEQSRLFQAGHKLFFKPAETETKVYATLLQNATGEPASTWIQRLSSLNKGECYSLGPSAAQTGKLQQKAFRIRIAALEERDI